MITKQPYTYTVLRYVHDVMTGEFVNVGLVMHAPKSQLLKAKNRISIGRIKGVFPDLEREAFVSAMRAVQREFGKIAKDVNKGDLLSRAENAGSYAHMAVPPDDSSLQWSPVGSGITDDFDKTFDRLYERFVSRYDSRQAHRRSDDDVWRPVREKLEERKLQLHLEEKTIVGTSDEISFRHAWRNGNWHAYEPLSLDLADADGIKDKARRWRGHLDAVADGAPQDIKLNFILGAPSDSKLMPAYERAVEILRKAPFHPAIFEEAQIDELVSKIEDDVRSHQSVIRD